MNITKDLNACIYAENTAEWTLLEATKNKIRIVKLGETVNCLSIDYLLNALLCDYMLTCVYRDAAFRYFWMRMQEHDDDDDGE